MHDKIQTALGGQPEEQLETGCVLVDLDENDYDAGLLMPVGSDTEDLPTKIDALKRLEVFNQRRIDACVGMGGAIAKSNQEKMLLSPRYLWFLCKRYDDFKGWGTSVYDLMNSLKNFGVLPYGVIDEDTTVDRDTYMRPSDLPDDHEKLAYPYRIESYWRVTDYNRTGDPIHLHRAMAHFMEPMVTTLPWYPNMNRTDSNGFVPLPDKTLTPSGHLVVFSRLYTTGGNDVVYVFKNSWSEHWGLNGEFKIMAKDLHHYNFGGFYIFLDVPADKARVLNKYNKQLVRNAPIDGDYMPEHYYVSNGQLAWIKNEQSFEFGRDAGFWGDWSDTIQIAEQMRGKHDLIF